MTWHKWQFAVVATAADDQTPWRHCSVCGRVEAMIGGSWEPSFGSPLGCDDPAIVRRCDGCKFSINTSLARVCHLRPMNVLVSDDWWCSEFQPNGGTQ